MQTFITRAITIVYEAPVITRDGQCWYGVDDPHKRRVFTRRLKISISESVMLRSNRFRANS